MTQEQFDAIQNALKNITDLLAEIHFAITKTEVDEGE